ncbi:aspartyl-phosphate phosphatase Spo0E family protein [Ammoniphilus sp. CFH 90114]|uniref:aspartyl-phosphate phosphatase Spo0E family protein n=1 Tax=Ammoniphilus sp. CFH 90114 TaxID=2493665 RepID=UPI001F0BE922|nr:aspartyl-phosphate phosphatase Spo0E family protein [Ammoniphilus sp. CFH 90114]
MASKIDILVEKIEKLREDMHNLAGRKGISSPEVLTISQQIDVELNHYYRLINITRNVCSDN